MRLTANYTQWGKKNSKLKIGQERVEKYEEEITSIQSIMNLHETSDVQKVNHHIYLG